MAQVNCYLPDELKSAAQEIDPPISFSELLRYAVADRVRQALSLIHI